MTYRKKMRSRSWRNREDYDLQEEKEIQVMEEQRRHDLQEKKEIQVMEEQGRA